MSLSKKDVVWSYTAQFFKLASGILILPIILRMLTVEEIALNYLLIALGAMVALFDFGFSPQFSRNITYVFTGATDLKKDGVRVVKDSNTINYNLLVNLIATAKYVYLRIALVITFFLLTFGTWYVYEVTDGFGTVHNALAIWVITILSSFLNFYFAYFDSLLLGRGLIKEANKAVIFSKIVYLILAVSGLYLNFGLLGISTAALIAALVYRAVSFRYFYDDVLRRAIEGVRVDFPKRKELLGSIWYNSRKLGLVLLSGYAINNFSIFLAGLYLDADAIASYGVLKQLVGVILLLSSTLFVSYNPTFSSLRIKGDDSKLIKTFAFSMNVYYVLFIAGATFLVLFGQSILQGIGSQAFLPSSTIIIAYCIVVLLEGNHSNFATFIVTKNQVPFLKSSIIAGLLVVFGYFFILDYTNYGIMGLIAIQGLVQLCYANWKWPLVVCREFSMNFLNFVRIGFFESFRKLRRLYA